MENPLVTYGFNKGREGIEQLGSAQSFGNTWKFHQFLLVKKLFEGKLVAHFLLDNSSKGVFSKWFDAEHWWDIQFSCVFDTECNLAPLSFLSSRT